MPSLGSTGVTIRDVSGEKHNHGRLVNFTLAAAWVTAKKRSIRYALDFDGSDDYVTTSWLYGPKYPLSLSAWVNLDVDQTVHILSVNETGTTNNTHRLLTQVGGTFRVQTKDTTNVANADGGSFNVHEWHHVVGVFASESSRDLYVDGVKVATNSETRAIGTLDEVRMGRRAGDSQEFDGQMGPAAIYQRALTPNEIQQLYVDPMAIVRPRQRYYAVAVATSLSSASSLSSLSSVSSQSPSSLSSLSSLSSQSPSSLSSLSSVSSQSPSSSSISTSSQSTLMDDGIKHYPYSSSISKAVRQ